MNNNEGLKEAIIKELEGQPFNVLEFIYYYLRAWRKNKA